MTRSNYKDTSFSLFFSLDTRVAYDFLGRFIFLRNKANDVSVVSQKEPFPSDRLSFSKAREINAEAGRDHNSCRFLSFAVSSRVERSSLRCNINFLTISTLTNRRACAMLSMFCTIDRDDRLLVCDID